MLGYIEFEESSAKAKLVRESKLGATFLVLDMGKGARGMLSTRRAARAAERMREQGVRRAVFPIDFPHTAVFLRRGIIPVDPMPLRRALSARFVQKKLELLGIQPTQAVVAVSGDSVSEELARTVCELARVYRYVLLSAGSGEEALAGRLRRQYGVSLVLAPSKDQLERADALVLFSPRGELRRENPVLCTLYPGGEERGRVPIQLGDALSAQVANNCSQEQLAAALHGLGVAPAERFLGEITC